MTYLDFELEISAGVGLEYPVRVVHSPAGEARATMRFPFDTLALENRLKDLQIALLRSGGKTRKMPLPEEQAVQDFGRALFDALFIGEVRTRYDMSWREATQKDLGLRLKLRIQSPSLAALPWEFLYDPRQAEYVCLSRNTPIVRYPEIPQPIQPLTVAAPLRILGMAVSPHDPRLGQLDVQREKQRVENATKDLDARGLLELKWLNGETWRDLQKAMRSGPWHIFHFIGHGGFDQRTDEGLIYLANEQGESESFTATKLGRLLSDHRSLRLVLLNACEGARGSDRDLFSSTAAILVRRGLPAVLAMQYSITDHAAIEFSRAFYEVLAEGLAVDTAVVEARKAVSFAVSNTIEWGTPVLYMRAPDGQLFNFTKAQTAPRPEPPKIDFAEQRRLELINLQREAEESLAREEWRAASETYLRILDLEPNHQPAQAGLARAQQELQLAALYAEAQQHAAAKRWTQALACLQKVRALSTSYKDVAQLISRIEQNLAEENVREKVAGLLREAEAASAREDWPNAIRKIQEILALEPNHPAAKNILRLAQQEQELAAQYAEAQKHLRDRRWQQALDSLLRLQNVRSHYKDVEEQITRARQELQKEQHAAQRQTEQPPIVTRPSSPAPGEVVQGPVQHKRGLVLGLGIAVLLIIIYIASQNREQQPERSPANTEPSVQNLSETPDVPAGMMLIPAGTFTMGSNDYDSEKPPHQVSVAAFFMDKYEVTVAQYQKFLAANPAQDKPDNWNEQLQNSNRPVVYVSWNDAVAYCAWLSKQRGKRVRLPTEAEWEYAARGGLNGKKYPWGDEISAANANYDAESNRGYSWDDAKLYLREVGSYRPNSYGLYDMAGNVWEWCADWYASDYYQSSPAQNPKGPASGTYRILRGGSWDDDPDYLRCADRGSLEPSDRGVTFGFRCSQDVR